LTANQLIGERWEVCLNGGGTTLRVPSAGTIDDLNRRHHAFLNRVNANGEFAPVPALSVFGIATYRSDLEVVSLPQAVFVLRQSDDRGFRGFDPARRGMHVAGMLRHLASLPEITRGVGWDEEDTRRIILGHGEARGERHQPPSTPRIAFLPLPSLERREGQGTVVGSIRRVLITTNGVIPADDFRWLIKHLDGQELTDEKSAKPTAVIFRQGQNDGAIGPYFRESDTWATVTPVILPGYDDPRKLRQKLNRNAEPLTAAEKSVILAKLDDRIDHLLRKAIRQAGFSEAIASNAELEWRNVGFWRGTMLASKYAVPEQHRRFRRLHVRIRWRTPEHTPLKLPGPICIGGGRFSGIGLFASIES